MNKKKISNLFEVFFNSEKVGGITLIVCTVISLTIANSFMGGDYIAFWNTKIGGESLVHWINDGLMTIFFLLIGLELEREVYIGELSKMKKALFPFFGALGGMLIPAGIFLLFNYGTPTQSGVGVPMATDIAFAIGVLALLGSKVPTALKIFLVALATIDDLGAILIIAVFYSSAIFWINLIIALAIFGGLLILNKLKVKSLIPYIIGGIAMWYFMLHSGVHATITGVLLAFAIPFRNGIKKSPSEKVLEFLHRPVAFLILPLFALANTAIVLGGNFGSILEESYSLGIAFGLLLGKPIGIFLFVYLATKLGWCKLPTGLRWNSIFSVSILGGIGFTMSIFIVLLAFEDAMVINNAKLIILLTSLTAGVIGYFALNYTLKKGKN